MSNLIDSFTDYTLNLLNEFEEVIAQKPLIPILFPSAGFGSLYIPNDILLQNIATTNPALEFINNATPYLKFLFLLLTILLTVVSFILQIKKLHNKKE